MSSMDYTRVLGVAALGAIMGLPIAASAAETAVDSELAEVTVTGSRIKRDGFEAPNPTTVIDSEQMEKLGQTNVAEVLASIPQNISNQSENTAGVFPTANVGSNFANLRGLNPVAGTRTLTLVDSRRFVPTSDGGAVDLNVIPSMLIARIESVTGGASAAYGSDAVGGVVNVILDQQFTGLKGQIDFGQTFQGDGRSKHISLAGGTPFGGDRGHVLLGVEYQDNGGIGDCVEARTWCASSWDYYTNNGIVDAAATAQRNPTTGAIDQRNRRYLGQPNFIIGPGSRQAYNVSSGVFRNLPPTPAVLVNKKFNDAGTGILDMDPGMYVSNLAILPRMGGDGDSTYADSALRVPLERYSLFGRGSWNFTDSLQGFAELAYAAREVNVTQQIAGPRSTFYILRDNAYLPASVVALFPVGGQASLGKDMDETLVGTNHSKADVTRALVGLSGKLSGSWSWDAYYQHGSNERNQTFDKTRVNDRFAFALDAVDQGRFQTGTPNGNIVCRALLSTNPATVAAAAGCVPLNLFGLNGVTEAAVNYAYSVAPEDFQYTQDVVAATFSGDLWRGWGAGPVTAAIGAEYRAEDGDVTHGNIANYNQFAFTFGQDYGGTIKVAEAFAELNVPLLKNATFARLLEFNGAIRETRNKSHDKDPKNFLPAGTDTSKSIDFTSWKLSAIWDPLQWLRVRATRSRDMRAAGFRELFFKAVPTESGTAQGRVNNPFNQAAPNTNDPTPILNAGNFGLAPEKADTWTAGVVLTPGGFAEGLRFSADWYEIQIQDAVSTTSAQQIVDFCRDGSQAFCDRITFNATPAAGLGSRGDITFIAAGQVNLGQFATRGLDLELGYSLPLSRLGGWGSGVLNLRTLATLNYDLLFRATPQAALLDYSGQTGTSAFADFANGPKWQLNSLLSYTLDRFTTTLSVRYIPSGSLNSQWIGPDDPRYAALIAASNSDLTTALPVNTVNDNTVKNATYFGLSTTYKVPLKDGHGSWEVFATINNLLDKDPPIAPGGNTGPGTNYPANPVYFDTLGAQFRAGLRVNF